MDDIVNNLNNTKNNEKYHDFCINEAINHILEAKEILKITDHKQYYDNMKIASDTFIKCLPSIYLTEQQILRTRDNEQEEN
tara:strand:- start:51 stop:293 length:243 start_codon:yes stop_codon:yes gene_type:complete